MGQRISRRWRMLLGLMPRTRHEDYEPCELKHFARVRAGCHADQDVVDRSRSGMGCCIQLAEKACGAWKKVRRFPN
jgi:hypothetical protein